MFLKKAYVIASRRRSNVTSLSYPASTAPTAPLSAEGLLINIIATLAVKCIGSAIARSAMEFPPDKNRRLDLAGLSRPISVNELAAWKGWAPVRRRRRSYVPYPTVKEIRGFEGLRVLSLSTETAHSGSLHLFFNLPCLFK